MNLQTPLQYENNCHELIGGSPCIERTFDAINKACANREPVLITGETGTGKELVARHIHDHGVICDQSFVPVDCCSLTPTLIESELFGYVRGAFTGATDSRQGLFEAANGGTLFLDEIGELPMHLQPKLLRAIQERKVRPIGATQWVEVDARIIAATNVDLESEVVNGRFRRDLYYRLNVLTIELPPLRKRKEDIPLLVNQFLKRCHNHMEVRLSQSAMDCLLAYDWPGNVRELENCIRRAVVWGTVPVIYPDDLPRRIQRPEMYDPRQSDIEQPISLKELERGAILRAIDRANGDKILASRLLGIGKTTIYRKLKQYNISKSRT